ncbi:hypothetical protein ACFOS3_48740 [Paractinoplanes deccanensis]
MRNARRMLRGGLTAAAVLLLTAGCVSGNAGASRELADSIKVEGFRQLAEHHKADTTRLVFVGPAETDLSQAVQAKDWSPQPPPSGLPDTTPFEWVLQSAARSEGHDCTVMVRRLRPGNEALATELNAEEKRELSEGKLSYLEISSVCMDAA